jgi:hypothetical protein
MVHELLRNHVSITPMKALSELFSVKNPDLMIITN